jgi:hypothetical protein
VRLVLNAKYKQARRGFAEVDHIAERTDVAANPVSVEIPARLLELHDLVLLAIDERVEKGKVVLVCGLGVGHGRGSSGKGLTFLPVDYTTC